MLLLLALLQVPLEPAAFELPALLPPAFERALSYVTLAAGLRSGLAFVLAVVEGGIRKFYGRSPRWLRATAAIVDELAVTLARLGRRSPAPRPPPPSSAP